MFINVDSDRYQFCDVLFLQKLFFGFAISKTRLRFKFQRIRRKKRLEAEEARHKLSLKRATSNDFSSSGWESI